MVNSGGGPGLPGQGLRPAADFRFAPFAEGVDRTAAQGFIRRKQPGDELLVGITGVREDHNRSLEAFDGMAVLDEFRRNATYPAFTDPQSRQRALVKKGMNLCNRNVQKLCDIGQGQPFAHKAFYITHGSRLPCRQALRLVGGSRFDAGCPDTASVRAAAPGMSTGMSNVLVFILKS